MGASPQQKAMQAAQASVEQAVKQGKKTVRDIESKVGGYRDLASATQQDLTGYLGEGQSPAEYYSRITEGFGGIPSMPEQIATYQKQLNQGDYPVLGSEAHKRFEDTLGRSANLYTQYAQRGLNEVPSRFATAALSPSMNLQLDPNAMKLAQGNLNMTQIKNLMTYNV